MESPKNNPEKKPQFEVVEKRQGITQYIFPHVLINIISRQQETRGAPELVYATFDRDVDEASMDRPLYKRDGVNMDYVVRCIRAMAEHSGQDRFWVYPYGDDAPVGQQQESAASRVRQWEKYFTLEPAAEQGYIMNV